MDASSILETGVAALLLAVTFLVGDRTRILGWLLTPPSIISFGGGMATAYVFLHIMPELHGARHEYGNDYRRTGRFVLAGMALVGWATALVLDLAASLLPLLLAFLSGAVIMNSLILELPTEKEGRFWPFMTGGLLYGLILLPLG